VAPARLAASNPCGLSLRCFFSSFREHMLPKEQKFVKKHVKYSNIICSSLKYKKAVM
jgi:hypothetical protein